MNKNLILIFIAILFLTGLHFNSVQAQNKLRITLHQPPQNQLSASNLWKMTLENLTDSALTIYLKGSATKDNIKVVDGTSAAITLPPGRSNYNYKNFETGDVNWSDQELKNFIIKTGTVPAAIYITCMQAFSSVNNMPLSIQTCIDIPIVRDPTLTINLIAPSDGESITSDNFTFNWAGATLTPGQSYKLTIKEITGNQSPEAAMQNNRIFFEKDNLRTTSFQYTSAYPKFKKGISYVWGIKLGEVESTPFKFGWPTGPGGPVGPVGPKLPYCKLGITHGIPSGEICTGQTAQLKINSSAPISSVTWEFSDNGGQTWQSFPGGSTGNPFNTNAINVTCISPQTFVIRRFRGNVTFGSPLNCLPLAVMGWNEIDLKVWCTTQAGNIVNNNQTICPLVIFPVSLPLSIGGPLVANSYTWSYSGPSGATFTTTGPNPYFKMTQPGIYNVQVIIKNGTCASITRTTQFNVVKPIMCVIQDISTNASAIDVCLNDYRTLAVTNNISPPGDAVIKWQYSINCSGTWMDAGTNSPQQNTNQIGPKGPYPGITTKLCWRAIVSLLNSPCGGCTTSVITYNIIQKACKPNITLLSGINPKCPEGVVTLKASTPTCGTGPFTYNWYLNGDMSNSVHTGQTYPNVGTAGNYTVVVSNKNNCDTTVSNFYPVKDCILEFAIKGPCCSINSITTLSAVIISNTCGTLTYHWKKGNDPYGGNTQSINIPAGSSGQYSLTVTTSMGCSKTVYFNILLCN